MSVRSRMHTYSDDGQAFEARIAWDDAVSGPRPGVLVSHAWRGRSDFEDDKAAALAGMGYVGFALDLYGKGVLGSSAEENQRLMQPFRDDRALLQRRMQLALTEMKRQPEVDGSRTAAIGFCFGGMCVLDLARSGADVRGVASFHGLLSSPGNTRGNRIAGRILVMHGWDDPMAPPEHVVALARELTEMAADWQLHAYGNTLHAFTNPAANDPAHGLKYDATAERRSMESLRLFLAEVLA